MTTAGRANILNLFPFSNRKSKLDCFKKFDKLYYTTGGYDDNLERFEKQGFDYAERLIKAIKPKKTWEFLDIGCGMGGIILALRKLGYQAWGTEVSQFCLENSPARKWMKFGNICSLPFPDKSFEVVITIDALCYLNKKELKEAIKELSRITRRFLYIETICKDSPNAIQKINPDPLRKEGVLLTEKELISLFEKEGFRPLGKLFKSGEKLILSPFEKVDFNYVFKKDKSRRITCS